MDQLLEVCELPPPRPSSLREDLCLNFSEEGLWLSTGSQMGSLPKRVKKTKQHTDSEPIAYSESGAQRLTGREPAEKEAVVKGFGNYFSYFLLPFS